MSNARRQPTLHAQLMQIFQDPSYRPPPLPSVAVELMAISEREDPSVDDVVRLLERDEMLTGSLIRLVSSPIYAGRGGSVRSLRGAVVRLGVRTVRDMVFDAALRRDVFRVPEYSDTAEIIGRHSTATAYISRIVCRHIRADEDLVFLSALLHDIGFAALLFALGSDARLGRPPLIEIWSTLDGTHELASKQVTKIWGLPAPLSALVGHHHHQHTGATTRFAAILNVSDALSTRFGYGVFGPTDAEGAPLPADTVGEVDFADARAVLGIDDAVLARIVADADLLLPQLMPASGDAS
ncbi:MAG TPA: HDOD domain-containing protein [Polyangiaceae bacterium]|nr:HDOD domain-containing protein [Polyangiaceae bacterium]